MEHETEVSAGQEIIGSISSLTIIVRRQVVLFPQESAMPYTLVIVIGQKPLLESDIRTKVVSSIPQLSEDAPPWAINSEYVDIGAGRSTRHSMIVSAGHINVGGVVSFMDMV
jgi:hypothetical protein